MLYKKDQVQLKLLILVTYQQKIYMKYVKILKNQ